eukprot:m.3240 g.3240  ORF g.3240 m.3240 type:complete len:196 (+) comp2036_c0_seq2:67-654(+)
MAFEMMELLSPAGIMKMILCACTFLSFVCVAAYRCSVNSIFFNVSFTYTDLSYGDYFMFTVVTGWLWTCLSLVIFAFALPRVVTAFPQFFMLEFIFSCVWFFLSIIAAPLFVDRNFSGIRDSKCGNYNTFLFGSALGIIAALLWLVDAFVIMKTREISFTTQSSTSTTTTSQNPDGSTTVTTTTTVKETSTALPF